MSNEDKPTREERLENTETLRTLLEKHPEWADLPIGVLCSDGEVDYIGQAGGVFSSGGDDLTEEERRDHTEELGHEPIETLVFYPN